VKQAMIQHALMLFLNIHTSLQKPNAFVKAKPLFLDKKIASASSMCARIMGIVRG
jgi:hypothetical protein